MDEINDIFVKSVNETEDDWNVLLYGTGTALFYYMIDLRKDYQKALKRGAKLRAVTEVNNDNIFYVVLLLVYYK